jgi:hypothetical protein
VAKLPLTKTYNSFEVLTGHEEGNWWDMDDDDAVVEEDDYLCSSIDEFCQRIKSNLEKLVTEPYYFESIHVYDTEITLRVRREETQEEIEAKLRAKEKAAAAAIKRKAAAIKRKEAEIAAELKLLDKLKAKYEGPISRDIET